MKRLQGFLIAIFVMLLIFSSFPNFAETVSVVFNSINLFINGSQVATVGEQFVLDNGESVPYSIIYKGTTYLPLKKVGQLLDKTILWDGNTRTVSINDSGSLGGSNATINYEKNSRMNPAEINETQIFSEKSYTGDSFEFQLTLTNLVRGNEAWQMVYSANKFNDEPSQSQEIILAKFNVKVTNASNSEMQFNASKFDFDLVSQEGKDYEFASYVLPSPAFDAKLYEGASAEGWVAFLVNKTDERPLIVYGKEYDGTGGVWFKGYFD